MSLTRTIPRYNVPKPQGRGQSLPLQCNGAPSKLHRARGSGRDIKLEHQHGGITCMGSELTAARPMQRMARHGIRHHIRETLTKGEDGIPHQMGAPRELLPVLAFKVICFASFRGYTCCVGCSKSDESWPAPLKLGRDGETIVFETDWNMPFLTAPITAFIVAIYSAVKGGTRCCRWWSARSKRKAMSRSSAGYEEVERRTV
jgi:hypothetical protein